ncbi:hypothetical protein BO79DRAFT_222769 [Aspergillus costaricaensis CBS 115574]|uniref:Uncharacterized protein n=1 Tax=Aspergillus costaricaensis CBS 115574 TaxID=1448317 RepID=A0ACD1HZL6_9EURO|nr:hypothetical protein BO79DRAFT_222769 [Aspergillus costaricaensis CBS 115574]RAK83199.1 hypothetical protein BO79DRAFT_222769 [Aspergillus costaricaensis CBS 115574]
MGSKEMRKLTVVRCITFAVSRSVKMSIFVKTRTHQVWFMHSLHAGMHKMHKKLVQVEIPPSHTNPVPPFFLPFFPSEIHQSIITAPAREKEMRERRAWEQKSDLTPHGDIGAGWCLLAAAQGEKSQLGLRDIIPEEGRNHRPHRMDWKIRNGAPNGAVEQVSLLSD